MIPVRQREKGDCLRAAVASVLEREYDEVWDFARVADESGRWWGAAVDDWLAHEGYVFRLGNFAFREPGIGSVHVESFWLGSPWWIASVRSKVYPGILHAVVMHGNEVAFDPGRFVDEPTYRSEPYTFIFANYFFVPDPLAVQRPQRARTPKPPVCAACGADEDLTVECVAWTVLCRSCYRQLGG